MEEYEISSEDDDISVEDDYDVHKELVHSIDKKMSVSTIDNPDTIEKARRFIFAEFLVSYIALEFHGIVYNTRLNINSDYFLNHFCETIRHAVRIIRRQIQNENSSSFKTIGDLSKSNKLCYEIFVDAVLGHYSQKGLKSGQFFYFSVYVSELAAKCYRTDFEDLFDFAVYAILDAFCVYRGKIYELIDFAEAVAHKSDQSFIQEDTVEIFGINLEKLKLVDKSDKHEAINIELEECGAALEKLNLVDKYEDIGKFEFLINAILKKMTKSVKPHVKNFNLSFCSKNCCISLIDEVHDGECKNVPYPTENKLFKDILQEVLSVVKFEETLFSAIYASSKKQDLESADDSYSTNTKDKIESSTCSILKNIQAENSYCTFTEQVDCIESKVQTLVNASITPNSVIVELEKEVLSANPTDALKRADVKFPSGESKVFELEQNQLLGQRSADNNVKSSISEFDMNFAEAEFEKKSYDKGGIVDYNTKEVQHNFIEKETKTFKEADITPNSEFKQEVNEKTLEDFRDILEYENLNIRNIDLKELNTVQHPLTPENTSENADNKLENFKKLKCESTKDLDYIFDNNVFHVGTEDIQTADFFAIYKSEGEIKDENLKVLKGDTILFAEDLVRYIMKEFYGISYSESKLDGIRSLSCNAFNETVKEVLNFICGKSETLNKIVFDIIENVNEHGTDCYRKYVATVLSHYVEDGLNSDAFLYFCLHFSELAAKFYSLEHPEIVDFAICSILDAFCLLEDDWCEFKVTTEKVLEIFKSKNNNQCTGCKIHCYVDTFERECVKAILDTIKTFLHEKIEMFSNNFMTVEEKGNHGFISKILENSGTDVHNSQSYKNEAIDEKK